MRVRGLGKGSGFRRDAGFRRFSGPALADIIGDIMKEITLSRAQKIQEISQNVE